MPTSSAGDAIPAQCAVIQMHLAELKQLFNAMDPSPFRERDLDPSAEEFIVGWSNDVPSDVPLALLIRLDRPAGVPEEAGILRDAVHEYFGQRALATRRRLRHLLSIGRKSLLIGLIFLAAAIATGDLVASRFPQSGIAGIIRESFAIGGWVAMWRPLEIFLYDWWPIRSEARNFDRLALMPVRIEYGGQASSDSWRQDWPAVAPSRAARTDKNPPARTLDT